MEALASIAAFLAQADAAGSSSSLVLQGGAFGLLAYIVAVLAPRMFAAAREEREARDKAFAVLVEGLQSRFEERTKALIEAMENQTRMLTAQMEQQTAGIAQAFARIQQVGRQ